MKHTIYKITNKATEDHKEKNRQAQIGRKHSEGTKAKMSERMKGKNNPNYGKKFSKEYREKLSKSHVGSTHSKKSKAKMSATRKKYYENEDNKKKQSKAMKGNSNAKKSRITNRVYYLSSNKPRDLEIVMTISRWDDGQFGLYLKDLNLFLDEDGLEMDYIKKWWRTDDEPGKKMRLMAEECRESIDEVRAMTVEELNEIIGF